MPNTTITVTEDERRQLAEILNASLKEKLIEEHRTRAPQRREAVLHDEAIITSLLTKLGEEPE
jgi:hypothetical protein